MATAVRPISCLEHAPYLGPTAARNASKVPGKYATIGAFYDGIAEAFKEVNPPLSLKGQVK